MLYYDEAVKTDISTKRIMFKRSTQKLSHLRERDNK